jgi:hypothetical protein
MLNPARRSQRSQNGEQSLLSGPASQASREDHDEI